MMHGLDDSADAWIVNQPSKAPAFVAARAGYDVWLGNWRGNKYSRRHVSLDPDLDSEEFFDFTFTDMAKHDLPSLLKRIKSCTGAPNIAYVGHSMGT